jgi:hypothetical protein
MLQFVRVGIIETFEERSRVSYETILVKFGGGELIE